MVRRMGGCCLAALAVLACACGAGASTAPHGTLQRPGLALQKAGNVAGHVVPFRPLRLKGGGRLNLGNKDKSDAEMAEADALTAKLTKVISKNRPIAQESSRYYHEADADVQREIRAMILVLETCRIPAFTSCAACRLI